MKKDLCKLAALVFPNTHYFKEHFKVIYFKNIDAVHDALEERFDQVFLIFSNAELKWINGECYNKGNDQFMSVYSVNCSFFVPYLNILATLFGRCCRKIKNVSTQERFFIKNVIAETTDATSATL